MPFRKTYNSILQHISRFQEQHPYIFSFIISSSIAIFTLFFTAPIYVEDMPEVADSLEFIIIETVTAQSKRIATKEISTTTGQATPSTTDRAIGLSDESEVFDISFYPNIVPPKPIGALKKIYPQSAREKNVEANVNVELVIAPDGKVSAVQILSIRLSKDLPPEQYNVLSKEFSKAAYSILTQARFTPPIINGQRVAIKMELPMQFKLE
ncbi:MAG: energy transducer TonB [Spirochaetota bacterium]